MVWATGSDTSSATKDAAPTVVWGWRKAKLSGSRLICRRHEIRRVCQRSEACLEHKEGLRSMVLMISL